MSSVGKDGWNDEVLQIHPVGNNVTINNEQGRDNNKETDAAVRGEGPTQRANVRQNSQCLSVPEERQTLPNHQYMSHPYVHTYGGIVQEGAADMQECSTNQSLPFGLHQANRQ